MPFHVHVKHALRISRHALESYSRVLDAGSDAIFNPNPRRFQTRLSREDPLVVRVEAFLRRAGYLDNRTLADAVVLRSLTGCQRQQWHTDFDPRTCQSAATMPLGILLALQDDTYFHVLDEEVFTMERGDVLIFSGDTVHAGAAYEKTNVRIHMYMDSNDVRRTKNTTYLLSDPPH